MRVVAKQLGVTIIALSCLLGGSSTARAGGAQWAYGNLSLSSDAAFAFPAPPGVAITWTATWPDFADVEFEFWRSDNGVWQRVQSYGAANTYTWTTVAGTHELQARARRITRTSAAYDVYRNTGSFVITSTPSPPPVLTALRTTTVFPLAEGDSVTWTAVASGAGLQYEFWRADNGVWQMVQPFGPSASYSWLATAGTHALQVRARRIGATVAYESYFGTGYFEVLGPRPVAAVSLEARSTSYYPTPASFPMPVYRSVRFVATATGGNGVPEYEFWRKSGGVWRVVQPYSTNPAYYWETGAGDIGTHTVQVRARNTGTTVAYQAFRTSVPFDVVVPVLTVSLTMSTVTNGSRGPLIQFSASVTSTPDLGCSWFPYQWWRWSGGVWTMVSDFQPYPNSSYTWYPTVNDTGANAVQVRVRDCYPPNSFYDDKSYLAFRGTGVFTLDVGAEAQSLVPDGALAVTGQPMTWTATAVGAAGSTLEYRFWKRALDGGWYMVRDYSPNPQVAWVPTRADADLGHREFLVWVRRVGSSAAYDAFVRTDFFVMASEAAIWQQKVTLSHGQTFLGCFNCPSTDPQSIRNTSGPYGSSDSPTSIWNRNSVYGARDSIYSACDASATDPPVLTGYAYPFSFNFGIDTSTLGRLTLNEGLSSGVLPPSIVNWLRDTVCQ
jgi:hypothetical protein